jgi:hypothetical protein
MTKPLDTYDPRWQERFASLSQLFKIHWALHAPREQLDSLVLGSMTPWSGAGAPALRASGPAVLRPRLLGERGSPCLPA